MAESEGAAGGVGGPDGGVGVPDGGVGAPDGGVPSRSWCRPGHPPGPPGPRPGPGRSGILATLVASSEVLSESTVPSATIFVPAAGVAVSPSEYVVAEEVWTVRWKPSKSVIVMVPSAADTTVPARCGLCTRGPRSGAPGEPGAPDEGAADGVGAVDVAAWATATPPTARTAAAAPATARRRPVRDGGGVAGPPEIHSGSGFTGATLHLLPEDGLKFSNHTGAGPRLRP